MALPAPHPPTEDPVRRVKPEVVQTATTNVETESGMEMRIRETAITTPRGGGGERHIASALTRKKVVGGMTRALSRRGGVGGMGGRARRRGIGIGIGIEIGMAMTTGGRGGGSWERDDDPRPGA